MPRDILILTQLNVKQTHTHLFVIVVVMVLLIIILSVCTVLYILYIYTYLALVNSIHIHTIKYIRDKTIKFIMKAITWTLFIQVKNRWGKAMNSCTCTHVPFSIIITVIIGQHFTNCSLRLFSIHIMEFTFNRRLRGDTGK